MLLRSRFMRYERPVIEEVIAQILIFYFAEMQRHLPLNEVFNGMYSRFLRGRDHKDPAVGKEVEGVCPLPNQSAALTQIDRCRIASNRHTAVAAAAFKDSTLPIMGMMKRSCTASCNSFDSPAPSLPMAKPNFPRKLLS